MRYRQKCPHCYGQLEKTIEYVHGVPVITYACVDCGWHDSGVITASDGTGEIFPGANSTGRMIQYTSGSTTPASVDETES